MWIVNTCQQHPFAEKSFSHDFFWGLKLQKTSRLKQPQFLDSLHLEEAESNTFESDAAWKYPHGSCPVFISGKLSDLEHPGAHPDDIAMLKKRLNTFCFSYVQQNPDRTIKPCGKCFAKVCHAAGFHG